MQSMQCRYDTWKMCRSCVILQPKRSCIVLCNFSQYDKCDFEEAVKCFASCWVSLWMSVWRRSNGAECNQGEGISAYADVHNIAILFCSRLRKLSASCTNELCFLSVMLTLAGCQYLFTNCVYVNWREREKCNFVRNVSVAVFSMA